MDGQEMKDIPESNVEQSTEQLINESAGTPKETNTAKIVWMVVMIVSFVLSITLFVMGIIGIFVSLGLLILPIVGIFGVIFTIICFLGAVLFLGLGIGSIFGVINSGKNNP